VHTILIYTTHTRARARAYMRALVAPALEATATPDDLAELVTTALAASRREHMKKRPKTRKHVDNWEANFQGGLMKFQHNEPPTDMFDKYSDLQIRLGLPEWHMHKRALFGSCLSEFNFTAIQTFGHIGIVLVAQTFLGGQAGPLLGTALHMFWIPLLIYASGPASGGHLNPMVTIASTLTGHTSLLRCVGYVVSQLVGAAIGAALMVGIYGEEYTGSPGFFGQCTPMIFGNNQTDEALEVGNVEVGGLVFFEPGRTFLAEVVMCFILLCFVYAIGFDPKQGELFGPLLVPPILGIVSPLLGGLMSAGIHRGWTGPCFNWAQGYGISWAFRQSQTYLFLYFFACIFACLVHSALFIAFPPHHAEDGSFKSPLLLAARGGQASEAKAKLKDGEQTELPAAGRESA